MSSISLTKDQVFATKLDHALRLFCSRVEQIPGVLETHRHPVGRLSEEGVTVVVDDLFSEVTHEVIHVQEMVYAGVPEIRFNLDIRDASTLEDRKL
jgi:hypothetical protein